MWHEAIISCIKTGNSYKYFAKVYDVGSEHGIAGGRVSKLTIRKLGSDRDLYSWDRGLCMDCADEEVRAILNIILAKYS